LKAKKEEIANKNNTLKRAIKNGFKSECLLDIKKFIGFLKIRIALTKNIRSFGKQKQFCIDYKNKT
jgi:hypothetical protein